MKYISPLNSAIWGKENAALSRRSNDVIFVSIDSENEVPESIDHGRILHCCLPHGADGINRDRYKAVFDSSERLLELIGNDSVIVLADMEPESLYPYKLLQSQSNHIKDLHVIGYMPWKFYSVEKKHGYEFLLKDLSNSRSAAFFDVDAMLKANPEDVKTLPIRGWIDRFIRYGISALEELEALEEASRVGDEGFFQYDQQKEKYVPVEGLKSPYPEQIIYYTEDSDTAEKG